MQKREALVLAKIVAVNRVHTFDVPSAVDGLGIGVFLQEISALSVCISVASETGTEEVFTPVPAPQGAQKATLYIWWLTADSL